MRSVVLLSLLALSVALFATAALAVTPVQTDDFETFPEPEPGETLPADPPGEPRDPVEDPFPLPDMTDDEEGYTHLPAPQPPLAIAELAISEEHVCALSHGGWLSCWPLIANAAPLQVPNNRFASVVAGTDHFCAIDVWGMPVCFDGDGALDAPNERLVAVAAGDGFSCGLDVLGNALCWGEVPPGLEPPQGTYLSIAAGGERVCVGGPAEAPRCFGSPADPQRPFGEQVLRLDTSSQITCGVDATGDARCEFSSGASPFDLPREIAADVAVADDFVCILDTLGDVHCEGPGAPALPEQPIVATAIAADQGVFCIASALDSVLCWDEDGEVLQR